MEFIFISSMASLIDASAVMVLGSGIIKDWIFMVFFLCSGRENDHYRPT
jgi:hypothetical protein